MAKPKKRIFLLSSYGLKYKLKIIICLVSVLPFLICAYLVSNYIMPYTILTVDAAAAVFLSAFIALVGFFVVKQVFDRVLLLSTEAKIIAGGDFGYQLDSDITKGEDEVADLSMSLNHLTQRIRENMDALQRYSEKTSMIKPDIQKRIFILSSLLEISSLISHADKLENIVNLAVEKSRLLANSDLAYLFLKSQDSDIFYASAVNGLNSESILQLKIGRDDRVFKRLIETAQPFILDKTNAPVGDTGSIFEEKFNLQNTLALPISLRGKVAGILGIANKGEGVIYKKEDIELLGIFAKQIAIAVQNDILVHRVEKLEVKDTLTGLYNTFFIRNRLQEEINRAIMYRRPCSFMLLNIDNFQQLYKSRGRLEAESTLKAVAALVKSSFTEVDRVARIGDNEFAIVLPEKNKRKAQEIAEEVRKKIESNFIKEQDINRRLTISGGVSENPLDGIDAEELIAKAKESLNLAKTYGKNRIIGFTQK